MDHLRPIDFSEEYLKEVERTFMLRDQFGALWYRIDKEECFISAAWVRPEFRNTGVAGDLLGKLSIIAKEHRCKYFKSQVTPGQPGGEISLISQFKLGFQLSPYLVDGKINLFKEIL